MIVPGKNMQIAMPIGNVLSDETVTFEMEALMRSTQAAFVSALGCVLLSLSIGAAGAVWFIHAAEKPDHATLSKLDERKAEVALKTQAETAVAPRVVTATVPTVRENETPKKPNNNFVPDSLLTVTAQAPVTTPAPTAPLSVAQPTPTPASEPAKLETHASKVASAPTSPPKLKKPRRAVAQVSDDDDEVFYRRSNDYRSSERGTVVYRTYIPADGHNFVVQDDDD